MAKRRTGVGKPVKSHSKKTVKRLEAKKVMLEELAKKRPKARCK
ncbi:MAG: hypothetical protein WC178_05490 [Candidatus Paceibacterota bacterium]